ncbi:hypothetical protein AB0J35_58020 [Nonomuraea angiospora]|uniref:hypothetical protein n=1 Tax=Nonomuraea angiospora TaxID=46172 RepID=UPI0034312407
MPSLIRELVLVVAAMITVHVISRLVWRRGVEHGSKQAKKDTQLAVLRGMATIRLQDARSDDIITEMREAS